jgi:hypothetical protein
LLDESDFADPLPTGLLHVVDELAWKAVKADPAVKTPESAAAEPTLTTGVVPVFVVVTPSKPHTARSALAADALRRLGPNIIVALNAQDTKTIVKRAKRVRTGYRRALGIEGSFQISSG